MTPYWTSSDGQIVVYHGDARDVLPTLTGQTIVVDPVWPNASIPLFGSDDPKRMLRQILAVAPESVIRLAIQIGCDSDPRFLCAVPERFEFFRVCWLDVSRPHYKGRLLDGTTPAYYFGVPPRARPGAMVIPGMFRDAIATKRPLDHPCPRKIGHVRWIVRWWSEPSDTVIDPCMGIGTTVLAAMANDRRAIGIEIEERYCEVAARRLEDPPMLAALNDVSQTSLFKEVS